MISRHICSPGSEDSAPAPAGKDETYCRHAADLIQSQPQEVLVAALGHQSEGGLLQAVRALKHQPGYVSDTLKGDGGMRDKCREEEE